MNSVYKILDNLKDELRQTKGINYVTFGLLSEVDLDKTTIFPLSHIILGQARPSNSIQFDITILFLDIVDVNNEKASGDEFYGNDNLQDVLNTQFEAANRICNVLKRNNSNIGDFQLVDNPVLEPTIDRFSNLLAGWELNFTIAIKNNMSIC